MEYVNEYGKLVDQYKNFKNDLVKLKRKKAYEWTLLREGEKSDASAERAWDRSEDGIQEMIIRANIDVIEAKMREAWLRVEVVRDEMKYLNNK